MSKPTKYRHLYELKPLTEEEYSAAPEAVRKVYISVIENIPLSEEERKSTITTYPDYFILKEKQVKKTFGQNFKRLSNLKNHRESIQKKFRAGTKVAFVKKEDVVFPPFPENTIPSCSGDCGMNYCDENGCLDRKRVLVDPTNVIASEAKQSSSAVRLPRPSFLAPRNDDKQEKL